MRNSYHVISITEGADPEESCCINKQGWDLAPGLIAGSAFNQPIRRETNQTPRVYQANVYSQEVSLSETEISFGSE